MASANSVALFKLVSGEEIIARIADTPSDESPYYSIKDPRVIALQPSGESVSFGLGPWVPWVLNEFASSIDIHQDRLLVEPVESLPKEIKDGYAQQVSGIQL